MSPYSPIKDHEPSSIERTIARNKIDNKRNPVFHFPALGLGHTIGYQLQDHSLGEYFKESARSCPLFSERLEGDGTCGVRKQASNKRITSLYKNAAQSS